MKSLSTTYTATILRVSGCCTSCCENDTLNWNSKQTFKLRAVGSISHTNALWHKYNTPASSHRFHWCLCSACRKVWLEIRDQINNHLQGHWLEATHSASGRKPTAGKPKLKAAKGSCCLETPATVAYCLQTLVVVCFERHSLTLSAHWHSPK